MKRQPIKRGLACVMLAAIAGVGVAAASAWKFALPTLDGQRFVQAAEMKRPALINFWRVDCPPCQAEIPVLTRFSQTHPDWSVWLVAMDTQEAAQRHLARHPVPPDWGLLRGGVGAANWLMSQAGNRAGVLPFTLVIDSRDQLCFQHAGMLDEPLAEAMLAACQ